MGRIRLNLDRRRWNPGLRLACLNGVLTLVCGITFIGTLAIVTLLTQQRIQQQGAAAQEIPFPYPLLCGIYALSFLGAWWRARRQFSGTRQERWRWALVGASPLLAAGVLGYAGVGMLIIWGWLQPSAIPAGSIVVGAFCATLPLIAAGACVGIVGGSEPHRQPWASSQD